MIKVTKKTEKIIIISGGQTGVDRAALDVAIKLEIDYGGFCPKGRLAEDGVIPEKYNLMELKSSKYAKRTLENVRFSDGSLVICLGGFHGGTLKTKEYCKKHNKPVFAINLLETLKLIRVNFNHWIQQNHVTVLNIAGPRESEAPVYDMSFSLLMVMLSKVKM